MPKLRSHSAAARRWQVFCRTGWRWAGVFVALWLGGMALLFRLAPAPAVPERPAPTCMTWWRATPPAAWDIRTLYTPAAFALSTPAGFTHALRREKVELLPPVHMERPAYAYLLPEPVVESSADEWGWQLPRADDGAAAGGVLTKRRATRESARLLFSPGWESRLFAGIDLNFDDWTNAAWRARVELQFDERGTPRAVLLDESSGWPALDQRLLRSVSAWRLLEPNAPRMGTVAWVRPGPATGAEP
jgi:hypothetical protein